MLAASEQVQLPELERWIVIGELGLDGSLRPVNGCVQAALQAKTDGLKGCIIPLGNTNELAPLFVGQPIYPASSLTEVIDIIKNTDNHQTITEMDSAKPDTARQKTQSPWLSFKGNSAARRAIEIAAAGGHGILLMGSKETQKTDIAGAFNELLPPMSADEKMELAKIYSVSGRSAVNYTDNYRTRPFRAPLYCVSISALFGGGLQDDIQPGEISLAHNGTLYLKDINRFPKATLEALRGPLEDRYVTLSRLKSKVTYPADFTLVASTEPCPCGKYGQGDKCTCTPSQRLSWLAKLNGSLLEHLDLQVFVLPSNSNKDVPEDMETVRTRVLSARKIQSERFKEESYSLNAQMPARDIEKYAALDDDCNEILERLFSAFGLSARAYSRIIKMARTIADLDGAQKIRPHHLAEAASYRFLDRTNWETNKQ